MKGVLMKTLKRNKYNIILSVIILSALLLYTYLFFIQKKGYNCDEIYSYGLANSFFKPFLENDESTETSQLFEEWFSGNIFHDYITVQPGEQFSYSSVWYNQSKDVHPPLYYTILHTICSFFPDVYSPLFALSINYFTFVLTMILLYKVSQEWGSRTFALIVCGFYAFSGGAADTYTFLRMYSLCAFFVVALFYEIYRYIKYEKKTTLLILFFTCLLASLTHYHLILFAFLLTTFTEVYLLIKKRYKTFFSLGIVMLLSVITAFFVFPSALNHLFSSGKDFAEQHMSLYCQCKYIISLIIWQFTGIFLGFYHSMFPVYAGTFMIIGVIIMSVAFFLFRNENLAPRFFKQCKRLLTKLRNGFFHFCHALAPYQIILFVILIFLYIFFVFSLPLASMKQNSIRYLFPFYPLLILNIMYIGKSILKTVCYHSKKFIIIPVILCIGLCSLNSNLFISHTFLYTGFKTEGTKIVDLPANASYILCVSKDYHLSNFSISLQNKQYIYAINNQVSKNSPLPASLNTLEEAEQNPIYLLFSVYDNDNIQRIDCKSTEEWFQDIKAIPYVEKFVYEGIDITNGYPVEIYRLK